MKRKLTDAQMKKLKEHSKSHQGGMMGIHMRNMKRLMEGTATKKPLNFTDAHKEAKKLDKKNKKSKVIITKKNMGY